MSTAIVTGSVVAALTGLGFSWHKPPARWWAMVNEIAGYEGELQQLDDRASKAQSIAAISCEERRVAWSRSASRGVCAGAGSVASRTMQLRHFDVQMMGGIALFHGRIAEMDTGEGKTLTATLPMYLHALVGKGAHLATVNDYLAAATRESMGPVYEMLGLTVGVIQTPDTQDQRRRGLRLRHHLWDGQGVRFRLPARSAAAAADGTDQDDFLGDGSSQRWDDSGEQPVQRAAHTLRWWTRPTAF